MDAFLIALNAVLPFVITVFFGYGMKAAGVLTDDFLKKFNSVIYRCFFPITMFWSFYQAGGDLSSDGRLLLVGIVSLLILVAVLMLTIPRIVKGNPQRGAIIQAVYRSNIMLFALPLVRNLFGDAGAAHASVMIAVIVPLYNVIAVIVLEIFRGGKISPGKLLLGVVKNPLIQGAAVGLVFLLLKIRLPSGVAKPVSQFSDLTTPLALFVLGGTLRFRRVGANLKYLVPSLFIKLLVLPGVITGIALALRFDLLSRLILLLMYATPVAASSYPMAENMGSDGELAGQFVVISTIASLFTLFFWIFLYGKIGLL